MKEAKATQRSVDIPVHESKTKRPLESQRSGLEGDSGDDGGMTGWETKTLGDVAQIERGKFSHRPRNEPRFYGGNTPFVQTGDVTRSNGIVRTYTQTLNKDGVAISKVFPEGTILITIAANIGYAGILEFESAAPDSLIGLTPDDTVNAEFLNFYLRTQQPEMDRMAPKGTQKNINIQFLKPWPVVIPPLPEQKKIAHILSTVQRAIEAQERIIQTTTELKKALMHKLFTEGLRNEPQKQTEIGPFPESWEITTVGDVASVKGGKRLSKGDKLVEWDTGFPYIRVTDFNEFSVEVRGLLFLTEEAQRPISRYIINRDDVFISIAGSIGITGMIPTELDGVNLTENAARLIANDSSQLHPRFLMYWLASHHCQAEIKAQTVKNAQPKLALARIKSLNIPLPPLDEQIEIASALDLAGNKTENARSKRDQLRDIFRTLLHELMTAKTRVHEIKITA